MNILFLNKFNDYWKEKYLKLKAEFPQVEFTAVLNPDERLNALKKADAVVCGRILTEEIEQSPNLKVIFVPFTGLNSFPLEIIKQKGIIISNTHANAKYVAERAVTLALALLGRVAEFHNDLRKGKWSRSHDDADLWDTIQNKSVGIIGLGHIGLNIARFVKAFGCRVYGFKRKVENPDKNIVDEVSNNLEYTIEKSNIIFVCLPLNSETKNLLNAEILAKMKGKYIINVGRGETISEEGMYNALKNGILKNAALDVWYNYPGKKTEPVFPAAMPFWKLPNVLLSPHKSSHTIEAVNAMIDDTCENIRSYIISGTPKQIVKL
jgi:phosphoglycerate dehydrogenase-like enzyme